MLRRDREPCGIGCAFVAMAAVAAVCVACALKVGGALFASAVAVLGALAV